MCVCIQKINFIYFFTLQRNLLENIFDYTRRLPSTSDYNTNKLSNFLKEMGI